MSARRTYAKAISCAYQNKAAAEALRLGQEEGATTHVLYIEGTLQRTNVCLLVVEGLQHADVSSLLCLFLACS